MSPHVVSVNVGRPAPLVTGRRVMPSAIVKPPVSGPVAARGVNLAGDEQADKVNHGGPDQAVYAYASEDAAWWGRLIDRELGPGAYLAIAREGELEAGDAVEIVHRPQHDVTVALVVEALLIDRGRVEELEPARSDMLPKLAAWYEERQAA